MIENSPFLLRLDEAAEKLRISKRTLYRLLAQGEMQLVKVRAGSRIPRDSIEAYVRRLVGNKQK
ncbi:MAG: hypothetical protein DHS20C16_02780 [Phycisphaerae bacterium]|nr:MAG: hypothetical protein DHS20C16_02780 [Phycisphaerae bacterium]